MIFVVFNTDRQIKSLVHLYLMYKAFVIWRYSKRYISCFFSSTNQHKVGESLAVSLPEVFYKDLDCDTISSFAKPRYDTYRLCCRLHLIYSHVGRYL
jgi:hypothetical protein